MIKNIIKRVVVITVLASSAMLAGCDGNIGVGLNVGIPIGNHGYMSLGSSRWY